MNLEERQLRALVLSVSGIGRLRLKRIEEFCQLHHLSLAQWWAEAGGLKSAAVVRGLGLSEKQKDHLFELFKKYSPASYGEYLDQQGIEVIFEEDDAFPFLLKNCNEYPAMLFVKGPTDCWNKKPVAVIGTRRMTTYGEEVTKSLVHQLTECGVTIVSGGMYGVDLAAHQAALERGGATVAVLGFGFEHWYPEFSPVTGKELLARGATLVTTFPPFMPPLAGNFPSRNKIVAGMSLGVVVVEAGQESGSHITAKCALEYGREIFAVPGPISNQFSQGTKSLINEGAKLVTSGQDIIDELGFARQTQKSAEQNRPRPLPHFSNVFQQHIYLHLQSHPENLEELAEKMNTDLRDLSSTLSWMELEGWVKRDGNKWLVY